MAGGRDGGREGRTEGGREGASLPVVRVRRVPARRAVLYGRNFGPSRSATLTITNMLPSPNIHTFVHWVLPSRHHHPGSRSQAAPPGPAGPLASPHDFHLPLLLHLHFLSLEQRPTERPTRPNDGPRFHSPLHFALLRSPPSASASASLPFPEKPRRTTGATDGS